MERQPTPTNVSNSVVTAVTFALLAIAAIVFAASRYYILAMLEPQLSDVQTIYFNKAGSAVDLHWKPYQEGFLIEYPPLAWWTIYATRLVDDRRIINKADRAQVVPIYESYRARFRGLMFFCDVARSSFSSSPFGDGGRGGLVGRRSFMQFQRRCWDICCMTGLTLGSCYY